MKLDMTSFMMGKKMSGNGTPGGSVSWEKLKDRPFYTENNPYILSSTNLERDDMSGDDGQVIYFMPNVEMEATRRYTVTYNGVDYGCTAIDTAVIGLGGGVFLGNVGAFTGEESSITEHPFLIVIMPTEFGGENQLLSLDGATSVNISIRLNGERVVKLDNKYLDLAWLPAYTKDEVLVGEASWEEASKHTLYSYYTPQSFINISDAYNKSLFDRNIDVIVYFDDVKYICKPLDDIHDGITFDFCIGNISIIKEKARDPSLCEDSGEPFVITSYSGSPSRAKIYVKDNKPHKISVHMYGEPYLSKIPMEFLPFGSKYENVTLLEETTLVATEETENQGIIPNPIDMSGVEKVTVKYNGVDYECKVSRLTTPEMGEASVFGNMSALGMGDSGEPFLVMIIGLDMASVAGMGGMAISLDGSTEFTLSIDGLKEVIAPIEEKYLPKPLVVDITDVFSDQQMIDTGMNGDQIAEAITSGRKVYFKNVSDGISVFVEPTRHGYYTGVDGVLYFMVEIMTKTVNQGGIFSQYIFACENWTP